MSGSVEYAKCEVCGVEGPLERTYFQYAIKCECHSPNHFEMVRHCRKCIPVEPSVTEVTLRTDELKKAKWHSFDNTVAVCDSIDLSGAKEGDKFWTIELGDATVTGDNSRELIRMRNKNGNQARYLPNGFYLGDAAFRSVFYSNPFKARNEGELAHQYRDRIMRVKDISSQSWNYRVVFAIKNGRALAWRDAKTIEGAANETEITPWRMFEEVEPVNISIEELKAIAASERGIPVSLINIVDK